MLRKKAELCALALLCLFCGAAPALSQTGNSITVEQINVPKVSVTNSGTINFFLTEFFIPETLVTKIDIIDATGNGFGEKDIAITQPSGEIYFIFPSARAQEIMNQWKFTPNFQIVGENLDPEVYEMLPNDRAENNIFSSLLRGINRNYQGAPIKLRFERRGQSTIFEMWGYNNTQLEYTPAPLPGGRDIVYIYTTVKDTLFIEK